MLRSISTTRAAAWHGGRRWPVARAGTASQSHRNGDRPVKNSGGGSSSSSSERRLNALFSPCDRHKASLGVTRTFASIARPLTPVKALPELEDGSMVSVSGWLASIRRVSRSLAFAVILLPRGQGRIQAIARADGDVPNVVADAWERAGLHGVVVIEGTVHRKPQDALRAGQSSDWLAQIEVRASSAAVLNEVPAGSLPFDPLDTTSSVVREEVRMRHRHLDLRGTHIGDNIRLRSKISWVIRDFLHKHDYTEIETPILLRSSPEGAREYLVPTRVLRSQGSSSEVRNEVSPHFYALQQSPQQPKQLLVSSGVTDRYFQIARCFRDEDGRKDRQPEFTQIDLEMGFVRGQADDATRDAWTIGGQEVRAVIEDLVRAIWKAAGRNEEISRVENGEFRVMQYGEAMDRYGSDKPDLRYGMELASLGDLLRRTWSDDHRDDWAQAEGTRAKDVEILSFTPPPGIFSAKVMQELFAREGNALSDVERFSTDAESTNVTAKLLLRKSQTIHEFLKSTDDDMIAEDVSVEALRERLVDAQVRGRVAAELEQGDKTWTFVAMRSKPAQGGSTKLGEVRRVLAQHLHKHGVLELEAKSPSFVWIIEFPLFTRADADKTALFGNRWASSHHPFTSPKDSDAARVKALLEDGKTLTAAEEAYLARVNGQHYDLVLDGVEIGGGSVRIHDAELQRRILANMLQLKPSEMARFRHLLEALATGAPPHAGIALGFDRLMAILCRSSTIRDVIAFPKSANGRDPLFGSPDSLDVDDDGDGARGGVNSNDETSGKPSGSGRKQDALLAPYALRSAK